MAIKNIERMNSREANFLEQEPIENIKNSVETLPPPTEGYGLHQVFNKDVLTTSRTSEDLSKTEIQKPSFLSKINPWWIEPEVKTVVSPSSVRSDKEVLTIEKTKPISRVPVLDKPEFVQEDSVTDTLSAFPPTSERAPTAEKLSPQQLVEGLSLMSEHSIQRIIEIILKVQLELEKENALVAEESYSKFQQLKKIKEAMLQEIKDVLEKDERIAGYLGSAQKLAIAASVICGLAAASISFGLLTPAGTAIGALLGVAIANTFVATVTLLGSTGTAVSAGLTGLATGSKAYFDRRTKEDQAKHTISEHLDKHYSDLVDETRSHLEGIANMDGDFKERLIYLLKRFAKIGKLVLEK